MNKQIYYALTISLSITLLLWGIDRYFADNAPLIVFNLIGVLELPGALALDMIVAIFYPSGGWQAVHSSGQYRHLGFIMNFVIYFLISYFLIKIMNRIARYFKG